MPSGLEHRAHDVLGTVVDSREVGELANSPLASTQLTHLAVLTVCVVGVCSCPPAGRSHPCLLLLLGVSPPRAVGASTRGGGVLVVPVASAFY